MQHSDGFCRVKQRQNESGVLRGGKFFCGLSLTEVVGLTVITQPLLQKICNQSTSSVGFVIENIMVRRVRQDDSEEIIYEWRQ